MNIDLRPVDVAVGILVRSNGDVLLTQRPAGKPYAGYWEFPGGKVEAGEPIAAALRREFVEELGIQIGAAQPWCGVAYRYPHADVQLHFFLIRDWSGEPRGMEQQQLAWQGSIELTPLLPATLPLLQALEDVRKTPLEI